MDSRDHDILRIGVSQIEHIVDHFLLVRFDDPAFMADIHDGPEFFFSHTFSGRRRIYSQENHKAPGEQIDDKYNRSHYCHEEFNDPDIAHRDLFGIDRRIVFGRNLSENEDCDREHCRGNADHISAERVCKCC